MPVIRPDWSRQTDDWGFFRYTANVTSTSDPIVFMSGMTMLSAAVHPAVAQTARIEFTLSPLAAVEGGTARWIPWEQGDVSTSKADALMSCVTALRGVASGGTAVLEIVAV